MHACLRRLVLATLCLFATCLSLRGQVPRDYAVDLGATISDTVPRITLTWTQRLQANITAQKLYRRLKGASSWGTALATLTTTQTSYADNTALANVEYEYWMDRTFSTYASEKIGYLSAGVKVPEVQTRGKLLLVVDDTMVGPLVGELAQLRDDLTADGWTVQQITAPRSGTATSTKVLIKAAYDADPTNVKMLYILGRVPVPYSGNNNPDGHGLRALPADGYYADVAGTWSDWTDTADYGTGSLTGARGNNVPGDGKFDPYTFWGLLELQVGRVDLSNMQQAPSSSTSETSLLRRYLRKAHDFRYQQGAYAAIPRRSLIRDGFHAYAVNGWAAAFTGVGNPPAAPVIDEAGNYQWFDYATASSYLYGHIDGSGQYTGWCYGGTSFEFGRKPSKVVFTSAFGSFSLDWDVSNAAMRSILAGNATGDSLGLTCYWAGRPDYFMHHMGMGETIGYSIRATQNSVLSGGGGYGPNSNAEIHLGLMGDPALRLHMVQPPRNLVATSANGQVTLGWNPSTETGLQGYHVYRAATRAGPFTKLTATPQAGVTYADTTGAAGQSYTYMVRTLKLDTVPGGSYYNLSHGSLASLTVNTGATPAPKNPTQLAVTQGSSTAATLTWTDNSSDETGFRIERATSATGTYVSIGTVGANLSGFSDSGPFIQGTAYFYRVFATNGAGDSVAADGASFEAAAGSVDFQTMTFKKVSRAAGTAQIPVERIGGVTGAISVTYSTVNSSAVSGIHFTGGSGTVSWADGESGVKNISIPLTNNATPQLPRQFRLNLSSPTNGAGIGYYNSMAVLIEDPAATLPSPWTESVIDNSGVTVYDSSPAVQAEGAISSTVMGGAGLDSASSGESGIFTSQLGTGDGMLTAYIPTPSPAQTGSRFAVMARDLSTNPQLITNDPMAATVTTGNSALGVKFHYRTVNLGNSTIVGATNTTTTPCWLRLIRIGNTFTSQSSTDGATWSTLGSAKVQLNATTHWGLFHISVGTDAGRSPFADYQAANFQNVAFGTLPAPTTPGGLAVGTVTATSVPLTWTASSFAGGYEMDRIGDDGTHVRYSILQDSTSYSNILFAADTAYQYSIRAYNDGGTSAWSAPVFAAPLTGTTLPSRPGFLSVTPGTGSNSLTWSDNSSTETGFQIDRSVNGGAWTMLTTVAANTKSYADNSVSVGSTYTYRVCATSAAGNSTWTTLAIVAPAGPTPSLYTWTGLTTGNWSDVTQWDGNGLPTRDGSALVAFQGLAVSATSTMDLAWTASGFTFNNAGAQGTTSDKGYTLALGANSLTLDTGTSGYNASDLAVIDVPAANKTGHRFTNGTGKLVLVDNVKITGSSSVEFGLGAGLLTGSGNLTQSSSTTLIIAGDNSSYTGNVRIEKGTLQLRSHANAMGSGTLTLTNGGALNLMNYSSPPTIPNNIILEKTGASDFSINSTSTTASWSGNAIYSGSISNSGAALAVNLTSNFDAGGFCYFLLNYTGNNSGLAFAAGKGFASSSYIGVGNANALGLGNAALVILNTDQTKQGGLLATIPTTIASPVNALGGGNVSAAAIGANIASGTATYTGLVTLNSNNSANVRQFILRAETGSVVAFNSSSVITNGTSNGAQAPLGKIGGGRVELNGANSYLGATVVRGGELVLGNNNALGAGTTTVSLGEPTPVLTAVRAATSSGNYSATIGTFTSGVGNPGTCTGAVTTLDGVPLAANDRVLIKDRGIKNGIYTVQTPTSTWLRATDLDSDAELAVGQQVTVTSGTVNAGRVYFQAQRGSGVYPGTLTLNTSPLDYHQDLLNPDVSLLSNGVLCNRNIDVMANSSTGKSILGGINTTGTSTFSGNVTLYRNLTATAATGGSVDFAGTITGGYGVTKEGAGKVSFSTAKGYTGTTTVAAGTLAVNSTLASSGVTVASGATLQGSGNISSSVTVTGTLAPGNSVGTLAVGSAAFATGGVLAMEADGSGAGSADRLSVGGNLNLTNAALNLTVLNALNDPVYVIASYGTLTGTFASVAGLPTGYALQYNYNGGTQIAIVSGYNNWAAGFGGGFTQTDFGADPDGDGLSNLAEYAFGLNPTVKNAASALPKPTIQGSLWQVSYTASATGVSYGAEWSTALQTWTSLTDSGSGATHTFSLNITGKNKLYFRHKIILLP